MTLTTCLAIFLITMSVVGIIYSWVLRCRHYRWFQSHMRAGDLCKFYLKEEKQPGKIVFISDYGHVLVKDEQGETHKVYKSEIYPVI